MGKDNELKIQDGVTGHTADHGCHAFTCQAIEPRLWANNANALLIRVFGPRPEGADLPAEYYKWLGIEPPPQDGDYFLGMHAYIHDKLGISNERLEKVYEVQGRVTRQPWVPKDCPPA